MRASRKAYDSNSFFQSYITILYSFQHTVLGSGKLWKEGSIGHRRSGIREKKPLASKCISFFTLGYIFQYWLLYKYCTYVLENINHIRKKAHIQLEPFSMKLHLNSTGLNLAQEVGENSHRQNHGRTFLK